MAVSGGVELQEPEIFLNYMLVLRNFEDVAITKRKST
jgi:hypothetical protein